VENCYATRNWTRSLRYLLADLDDMKRELEAREAILKIKKLARDCWSLYNSFEKERFYARIIGAKCEELEEKLRASCSTIEHLQFLFP